jgi:DNA-binding NtrC family response regulator
MATVLLSSNEESLIETIRHLGERQDDLVLLACRDLKEACAAMAREEIRAVMIHVTNESDDAQVTEFLQMVAATDRPCPTVVLADAYRDSQAIAFFCAGAADYLSISQDLSKLNFLLDLFALRFRPESKEAVSVPVQPRQDPFFYIVAPETAGLVEQVRRVAPQSTTILLTGETGTGKSRLARVIHDLSPRREQPFMVVDCGALSANLIESEMFGHVRGAFTGADRDRPGKFAAVGDGTLLLDEINSLPIPLQGKLLRAIDEFVYEPVGSNGTVPLRARLIAASNVPLDQQVLAGKFRADLFYRLNVVGFFLPPLREQRSAIAPLCHKFLAEFAGRNQTGVSSVAPDVLQKLTDYDWPGNVRELRNVVERAVALAQQPGISLQDLPERIVLFDQQWSPPTVSRLAGRNGCNGVHHPVGAYPVTGTLHQVREEIEIQRIRAALRKHRNNRLRAAVELGISRMGLYKKLHKYGLLDVNEI